MSPGIRSRYRAMTVAATSAAEADGTDPRATIQRCSSGAPPSTSASPDEHQDNRGVSPPSRGSCMGPTTPLGRLRAAIPPSVRHHRRDRCAKPMTGLSDDQLDLLIERATARCGSWQPPRGRRRALGFAVAVTMTVVALRHNLSQALLGRSSTSANRPSRGWCARLPRWSARPLPMACRA